MQLAKVRRRWTHRSVPATLRRLGIEFRVAKGKDFWEANREHLHFLFQEFQSEARDEYRRLHTDTGAEDRREFQDFSELVTQVRDSFHWHLQSIPKPVDGDVLVVRFKDKRKGDGPSRMGRALEIAKALLAHKSKNWISRNLKTNRPFIQRVIDGMDRPIPDCPCGLRAGHRGWCDYRERTFPRRKHWKEGYRESAQGQIDIARITRVGKRKRTVADREKLSKALKEHHRLHPRTLDHTFHQVRARVINGTYGHKHTEESKKKMSRVQKELWKTRTMTPENKAKLNKGRQKWLRRYQKRRARAGHSLMPRSPAYRQKMSEIAIARRDRRNKNGQFQSNSS